MTKGYRKLITSLVISPKLMTWILETKASSISIRGGADPEWQSWLSCSTFTDFPGDTRKYKSGTRV